ncbi:hypothetical protein [Nocardioides ultimimeridianus]
MSDPDPMDDAMDDRLTRAGQAWRADLPAPAEPVLAASSAVRRRRWLVPATAAAMVLVVAGVAAVIGRGADKTPAAGPDPAVVPWADLPATHPRMPVRVVGGVSPAQLAAAPVCGAGDLRPGAVQHDGAMGTEYLDVALHLSAGHQPCRIDARYPDVVLTTSGGGTVPVGRSPVGLSGNRPRSVLVTPAAPAEVVVAWSATHDCRNVDNTGAQWRLGTVAFQTTGFGRTSCNPGEGPQQPYALPVTPGYSAHRVSPYDGLDVSGHLVLTAQPGRAVDFTVTLTSRHDLSLDPCPDYRIAAYTGVKGADVVTDHALNCAAVPYRTPSGTPYLPAGVPVTFAMRMQAPRVDAPKLVWELIAPPSHPARGGSISVGPPASPGTLTGRVTMDGMTSITVRSGTVTLVGDDGSRTVARIASDGTYRASVPAGAYTLVVSTRQWNGGAPFKDRAGVTGGTTNTADISLPMK